MIRRIKTTAAILGFAIAFSGVCGCDKGTVNVNINVNTTPEVEEDLNENAEEKTEEESVINKLALKGPYYTGMSNLTNENNEDGTYTYEDMTEDGITVITNTCYRNSQRDGQDPDAYAQNFVCAIVDNDAKVSEVKEDEKLSASLFYPTYRVYWETGSNEDTRQSVGVVVLTDDFTYYYGFGCPIDYYEDNADFYEEELDTVELIDLTEFEESEEESSEKDNVRAVEDDNAYGELYIDKINELKSDGLADQFALADIDADDTPELIASDSEGSFNHDNAFIFTIFNDEVVQLASVIAGVDGGHLDFSKGANLIHVSGAVAGMRDTFYEIKDGELEEVFAAEATSMDDDAKYSVNGSDVDEEEYYKQINGFIEKYNPLTRIAFDGLYEINYTYEDGFGYFEEGRSEKYDSYDDITE